MKKLLVIVLALTLALTIFACGKKAEGEQTEEPALTEQAEPVAEAQKEAQLEEGTQEKPEFSESVQAPQQTVPEKPAEFSDGSEQQTNKQAATPGRREGKEETQTRTDASGSRGSN